MKCLLMNKNTAVLSVEYDAELDIFSEVYELFSIQHAPLIVYKRYQEHAPDFKTVLSKWFRGRGIPSWRDRLDVLLVRLGVDSPEELLNKSFGLSLSDQYWLKPADLNISYDDINFFDHDFDSADFLDASFSDAGSSSPSEASLKTPNNTTDGMLKKSWIIEDGKRYLLKGGFKGDNLQPFNEVLATEICKRLGFSHVPYTIDVVKNKIVSKCECFITKDAELIPAYQVLRGEERGNAFDDYETYLSILEEHGLADARDRLEEMYLVDYLMLNEDRHTNNFGIIRDVNTLEWVGTAPIFDSGQSLLVSNIGGQISLEGAGRFFYDMVSFNEIFGVIRNPNRFDLTKLLDLPDFYYRLLKEYQAISAIDNARIEMLCKVLAGRIKSASEKQG